jgi:hypothetical protein
VELVTLRPPRGNKFQYAGAATYWDPAPEDREAMRDAVREIGELLRSEVDYRGAFTVDGIMSVDGWVPTELNPRYGAGLGYAGAAVPDAPLDLLHHLVIEGEPSVRATDLEAVILPAADASRWGAGWTTVAKTWVTDDWIGLVHEGDGYRSALDDEIFDATITRGPSAVGGFVRAEFVPARVEVGPSIAPLVVDAFAFADRTFGTDLGPLSPPVPVR